MEKLVDPRSEYVKEIAWAVLVIDVIIGLCVLLLSPHVGRVSAAWMFAGLVGLVTVVIGGIVLVNATLAWLFGRWEQRRSREQD